MAGAVSNPAQTRVDNLGFSRREGWGVRLCVRVCLSGVTFSRLEGGHI